MKISERKFTVEKTARVCLAGNEQNPRTLWLCLHGYGQLVPFFIKNCTALLRDDTLIAAPEGLHRFYLSGHSGRVGASWMTREERLTDIADYCRYLENIVTQLVAEHPSIEKINLLGFSQGVATALRWANVTGFLLSRIVCWGGTFPPDLDGHLNTKKLADSKIDLVFGKSDEFFTPEKVAEFQDCFSRQGLNAELTWYDGGHSLESETLSRWA